MTERNVDPQSNVEVILHELEAPPLLHAWSCEEERLRIEVGERAAVALAEAVFLPSDFVMALNLLALHRRVLIKHNDELNNICLFCEGSGREWSGDGMHLYLCSICGGSGNLHEFVGRDGTRTPHVESTEEPPF